MFNIPKVTKNLLILNILAFIAMFVLRSTVDLNNLFGLHFFLAHDFHIYQLVTYMFMHANIEHIFFNMFGLWMFGCVVERMWGGNRFLLYYLVCGIGAGLSQEIAQFVSFYIAAGAFPGVPLREIVAANQGLLSQWTTVGASGAIYGILLAFGMLFPEDRIFIFPLPIPIKAKWFVVIFAGVELFSAIATPGDNVAHVAHLGGMIFGYLLIRYWKRHPFSNYYGCDSGEQFFGNMKRRWEAHQRNKQQAQQERRNEEQADWDYNARKKEREEETDRILDKIRRSGYDSLTAEEKRRLFDNSKRQ